MERITGPLGEGLAEAAALAAGLAAAAAELAAGLAAAEAGALAAGVGDEGLGGAAGDELGGAAEPPQAARKSAHRETAIRFMNLPLGPCQI
jgi:hypothetical protein